MIRRHPSRKKLEAWLTSDDSPELDEHVYTCERCSATLDAIATAETDSALRDALNEALAAPPDLAARMEAGVVERLNSREVLAYMADLFGAGWEVTRLLVIDEPEEDTP